MKLPGNGTSWKEFLVALAKGWSQHQISTYAGALAFSAMLALFPFLIFLVALAGLVVAPEQVQSIVSQLQKVAPPDVTKIVGQEIQRVSGGATGLLTIGILGAIWAASGGAAAATTALNETYGVRDRRPIWKTRGLAVLATLLVAGMVLLASVIFIGASPVSHAVGGALGWLILLLRWPVSGLIMMLVVALLYYLLPDVEQSFKLISPGSVAATVVWLLASWGFTQYVNHFGSYTATYGALGGFLVLLMWMYVSSVVFILGSEVNGIIEHESAEGKRAGARRLAETGETHHGEDPATARKPPQRPSGARPEPHPSRG